MLIVAPPIEMVDPLFPYAIALLGPDTVITAKEVPQVRSSTSAIDPCPKGT